MVGAWTSLLSVIPTLLAVAVGAMLHYWASIGQLRRQEAERSRTMLRSKLEEISVTVEEFRGGFETGTMAILEFSVTGKLRGEETGMKKFPRLEMLVKFYAPSLTTTMRSLRHCWELYGKAIEEVIASKKLGQEASRKAMGPILGCQEQMSRYCDELQTGLVRLLHETLS